MSRRCFLTSGRAGLAAGRLAGSGLAGAALVADFERRAGPAYDRRVLLKGGLVLTMDPALGDFEQADVLIDGSTIAEVAPNIEAAAQVIDASGMIVMPGFIDTHHHQYETIQRSILSDGILRGDWPERTYFSVVQAIWTQGQTNGSIWDGRPTSRRTTTSRN